MISQCAITSSSTWCGTSSRKGHSRHQHVFTGTLLNYLTAPAPPLAEQERGPRWWSLMVQQGRLLDLEREGWRWRVKVRKQQQMHVNPKWCWSKLKWWFKTKESAQKTTNVTAQMQYFCSSHVGEYILQNVYFLWYLCFLGQRLQWPLCQKHDWMPRSSPSWFHPSHQSCISPSLLLFFFQALF